MNSFETVNMLYGLREVDIHVKRTEVHIRSLPNLSLDAMVVTLTNWHQISPGRMQLDNLN
jgi:hypothetical protein